MLDIFLPSRLRFGLRRGLRKLFVDYELQLLFPDELGCAVVYVDVLREAEVEEFPHEGACATALQLG